MYYKSNKYPYPNYINFPKYAYTCYYNTYYIFFKNSYCKTFTAKITV